jgi:hypothetical protein
MSQQLRDLQASNETLRNQAMDLQSRMHTADRARDRAELKLEMVEMSAKRPAKRPRGWSFDFDSDSTEFRRCREAKRTIRREEVFEGGGGQVTWVTDPDVTSSDDEKENINPNSRQLRRTYQADFHLQPPPFSSSSHQRSEHNLLIGGSRHQSSPLSQPHSPPRSTITTMTPPGIQPAPIQGNAVELTVTPHHGQPLSFVISPGNADRSATTADADKDDS